MCCWTQYTQIFGKLSRIKLHSVYSVDEWFSFFCYKHGRLSFFLEQSSGIEKGDTFCFWFLWNKQKKWVAWVMTVAISEQIRKWELCLIDKWSIGSKLALHHLTHRWVGRVSLCCIRAASLNYSRKKLDTKLVLKPNSFLGPVMLWISCWSIQTSLLLPVGKLHFLLVPSSTGRSEVVISYKQMSRGWKSFTALPVDPSDVKTFVNKEAVLTKSPVLLYRM